MTFRTLVNKVRLYAGTVVHLRKEQVFFRIWQKVGGSVRLRIGYVPSGCMTKADLSRIVPMPEIDFDASFLGRFDCEEFMGGDARLLHHVETVDWGKPWSVSSCTPLWNYNLHYCEYLLAFAYQFVETNEPRYLERGKQFVLDWIAANPSSGGGCAWSPYVISQRVSNWLSFCAELGDEVLSDDFFVAKLNESLMEQYLSLANSLEKSLMANHYLENLKAMVMLSAYFGDMKTLRLTARAFYDELQEQILSDGMHFERSPMYHKVVLEGCLRVARCLETCGEPSWQLIPLIQSMVNCLYSLERNTSRTPLFNDSGDNVAKSMGGLLHCARRHFGVSPVFTPDMPEAGYYISERETAVGYVKVIFDAGAPGPSYALGHAHCDGLSFECFIDGEPWIVNSGTYAYQDEERLAYKAVGAHNSFQVDGCEHMECWAPFRVLRGYKCECVIIERTESRDRFVGRLESCNGVKLERELCVGLESLTINDRAVGGGELRRYFHFAESAPDGTANCVYSPEFGKKLTARRRIVEGEGLIVVPYNTWKTTGSCWKLCGKP